MKDCEEGEKGEMCGGGREGREEDTSGHNDLGERLAFLLTHVPSGIALPSGYRGKVDKHNYVKPEKHNYVKPPLQTTTVAVEKPRGQGGLKWQRRSRPGPRT